MKDFKFNDFVVNFSPLEELFDDLAKEYKKTYGTSTTKDKIEVALPGVKREEIVIKVADNKIFVNYKPYNTKEWRTLNWPIDNTIDRKNITSKLENGMLIILLPTKKEPDEKGFFIPIG